MSNIDTRALREAAERATESDWIVDAHEGWHAVIPVADAVNGNYIIAEFQGPESKRNRDFVAAANPVTVLALLDELSTMSYRVKTLGGTVDIVDQQRDIWMGRCKDAEEKLEAAEKRSAELIEFLKHVKKCLVKNGEYAPLSHEEIDTLLGIRAAGIGVKGE